MCSVYGMNASLSLSLFPRRYISLSFDFHSIFFTIYPHHVTSSHSQHHTPNINIIHPAIYTHYTPLAASYSFEDLVWTGGSWAGTKHYFYRLSCCPEAYHSLHWIYFSYTRTKTNREKAMAKISSFAFTFTQFISCIILWDIQSRVETINFHHCASIPTHTAVMEVWDWDICIRRWKFLWLEIRTFRFLSIRKWNLHERTRNYENFNLFS